MRFGSTVKVLAECKLEYYRISECGDAGRSNCSILPCTFCDRLACAEPASSRMMDTLIRLVARESCLSLGW